MCFELHRHNRVAEDRSVHVCISRAHLQRSETCKVASRTETEQPDSVRSGSPDPADLVLDSQERAGVQRLHRVPEHTCTNPDLPQPFRDRLGFVRRVHLVSATGEDDDMG